MNNSENVLSFSDLRLSKELLSAVSKAGYTNPSKIQEEVIPLLLSGKDIVGQAETGSGKTGAFALPLLSKLENTKTKGGPEILVLAPTRELAMQVADSFRKYSTNLPWVKTVCIYGGQGYKDQIQGLRASPQIVVGTPGRIIDHIEKGFLKLDRIKGLVLDEADEMLKMGFQEDVEFIVSNAPKERQTALFSATMPPAILTIAKKYLINPIEIRLKSKSLTSKNISQKYWMVSEENKLNALTRLLELGTHKGVIAFVRTKNQAVELTERLIERGFTAAPLNGDITQAVREKTVARFKAKKFDVLVATDVAARGLDIEHVDLIVNYDIPFDPESYVHRIGRTGRAGSSGEAILFVTRRDLRALSYIEKTIKLKIEKSSVPTAKDINVARLNKIKKELIIETKKVKSDESLKFLVRQMVEEEGLSIEDIAVGAISKSFGAYAKLLNEDKDYMSVEEESEDDRHNRPKKRFNRRSRDRSAPPPKGRGQKDRRPPSKRRVVN